ncbi:MAG: DUF4245 domain-containing protein [Cryobacterium sp.]|nr:DUF4245 domain-containing protein [Cryobacterium sp.]
MSSDNRPIVAELGRPETPQETADRKAASSQRYRASKTVKNLLWAFGASLVIAVFLVLLATRPDTTTLKPVDVTQTALEAAPSLGATPAVPDLDGWVANAARLEASSDGVTSWYVGLLTAEGRFIAVRQGVDANPTWLAQQLDGARATGERSAGGVVWQEYDRRANDPTGIRSYSLVATIDSSTIVLFGTAGDTEFTQLATSVAESLKRGK